MTLEIFTNTIRAMVETKLTDQDVEYLYQAYVSGISIEDVASSVKGGKYEGEKNEDF